MTHLKEGEKAPDFTAKIQNGETIHLSDYLGKKVILYFYPKDMTPGCTAQACNLSENYAQLNNMGMEVIGVSADSEKRHQKFIEKYDLKFNLIADEELELIKQYGVWGTKKMYGREYEGIYRETFVIDEKGIIEKIILKVKTKTQTEQILELLGK